MDLFQKIQEIAPEKLHPKFTRLCQVGFESYQQIIQDWVEGFSDRDGKIVKEFQTTYHSSLWEFYLYALFKKLGFAIHQTHNRPDFIISKESKIYVEAVVSNIKQSGRPEKDRGIDDVLSMFIPPYMQNDFYKNLNEAIIRQSSALSTKKNKYIKQYSKLDWVNTKNPFVVALSSHSQVNYGREYIYPMLALLYGKYYNTTTECYEDKKYIQKPESDANIEIGIFNNEEYADISAVIYCATFTQGKISALALSEGHFNYNTVYSLYQCSGDFPRYRLKIINQETPEKLEDGIFIFHNPNAKNKLNIDDFYSENITHFFLDEKVQISCTPNPHLVVRQNFPSSVQFGVDILLRKNLRFYNKCSMEDFYHNTNNSSSPDFDNDCCIAVICENIYPDLHNDKFIFFQLHLPKVMPDEKLQYEAKIRAEMLINEGKFNEKYKIIIMKDINAYKDFQQSFIM